VALNSTAIVVLAAGKGTRMKSDMAKVLHPLMGKPMIQYVVETAAKLVDNRIVVVVGHQAEAVRRCVEQTSGARFAEQQEQLGTGHAVQCAMSQLDASVETVVVLCGDVPLISHETLSAFVAGHHDNQRDISVLSVRLPDPTGYGRVITDAQGRFTGIVEEKDASDNQRNIDLVNSGIYCIGKQCLHDGLAKIRCDNAQGEYYLTDIVHIGHQAGWCIGTERCSKVDEVAGINTLEDLNRIEKVLESRKL
jgi:UDP-N-acetylglucosamine diphosphorylase/glucosamine-1-phosphate N-acetyltransferase